ncbi:decaprenyl-phosphate phosphoribosyltransferase [Fulvivirga sedimenti]|uniref:Decaprenyl-phosphate phosphoribosyltransferase n=1 Tax=Fulvivirga sedimenti TaxID=2879465 RepID=A0A9X1HVS0_9BACT|nr:decaprenyl-phosphate phosphoribosyltransferase [Fulvivirga sedimenti]MCA6078771.1 decaprenyl-phosphate phosphoribosyltransferase [Fulvivirga sedimenti]
MNVKTLFGLLRVHQWIKNLFLFIPLFFAGQFFNLDKLVDVSIGFICFSLAASFIYILNDIRDIEQDKLHPEKKYRPIPAGKVSVGVALSIGIILLIASVVIAWRLNELFTYILISYIILNLSYSLGLKKISILDLIIVATGFVLRVLAGGFVAEVPVSHWLIVMIYLLALFLVLAKRRDDILEYQQSGVMLRKNIQNYNLEFIHSILTLLSAVITVSYIMYTISDDVSEQFDTNYLYLTSVFVIAGIMRYIQITMVENKSGSPTRVLYTDRFLHITLAGWIVSFFLIIYAFKI